MTQLKQFMAKTMGTSDQALKCFIERIERLDMERFGLGQDIAAVYAEAESAGFDKKALKRLVAIRKIEESQRKEQAALVQTYASAIGMQLELGL